MPPQRKQSERVKLQIPSKPLSVIAKPDTEDIEYWN